MFKFLARDFPALVLACFCILGAGCDQSEPAISKDDAAKLAKEHFALEFPENVYDDVSVGPGSDGGWEVEFRRAIGQDYAAPADKTYLETPVIIAVDGAGKCVTVSGATDN